MGYCSWADSNPLNKLYHDVEWGRPVRDDRLMFEHLTLECLQCGLSWTLILKRRDALRAAFDDFDFDKIAAYSESDIERVLASPGMIRSIIKIQAIVGNAQSYQKIRQEYGSFCSYLWSFTEGKILVYMGHDTGAIPVSNGLSLRISRDLKRRGFKYVGPVTIYSHLQAAGLICDHDKDCICRKEILEKGSYSIVSPDEEVF